jgi:hypothetical protein
MARPFPGGRFRGQENQRVISVDPKSIDERINSREAHVQPIEKQQFDLLANSFQELFTLLEEYAPVWYTKQHHQRALRAQRLLQKL